MDYPPGFPDRFKPAATAAILKARRQLTKGTDLERIKAAVFAFAEVACSAAEAGDWEPHLALVGIESFVKTACDEDPAFSPEFIVRPGVLTWGTYERFERAMTREVTSSAEWLEYMERLARLGKKKSRPLRPRASESLASQLRTLKEECRLTEEELAEAIGVDSRSVQRHLAGESVPYKRHLRAYEREFSKRLNRKIVIANLS